MEKNELTTSDILREIADFKDIISQNKTIEELYDYCVENKLTLGHYHSRKDRYLDVNFKHLTLTCFEDVFNNRLLISETIVVWDKLESNCKKIYFNLSLLND